MIRTIRAWLTKRAEAAQLKVYDAGWSWAAGRLLAGDRPEHVADEIEVGRLFDDGHPFDRGAQDALNAWQRLPIRVSKGVAGEPPNPLASMNQLARILAGGRR